MNSKKQRGEPAGKVVKVISSVPIERRRYNGGPNGRWSPVFMAFDKLEPSATNGIGIELENESDANRCGTSIHSHANSEEHPGWKVRTSTKQLPNGNFFMYAWKEPFEPKNK